MNGVSHQQLHRLTRQKWPALAIIGLDAKKRQKWQAPARQVEFMLRGRPAALIELFADLDFRAIPLPRYRSPLVAPSH